MKIRSLTNLAGVFAIVLTLGVSRTALAAPASTLGATYCTWIPAPA